MIKTEYRDFRHWSITVGNWYAERWCPGTPCRLVRYERHRVRIGRMVPR